MQIGEIHAPDEKDRADSGKQQPKSGAEVPGDVNDERIDDNRGLGGKVAGLIEGRLDRVQFSASLRNRYPGADTGNGQVVVVVVVAEIGWIQHQRGKNLIGLRPARRARHPDRRDAGKLKSAWQNAHHRLRHPAAAQRLPDGVWIAMKVALEGFPGEDHFVVMSLGGFGGEETAAENGLDAKNRKEIRRDAKAIEDLRVIGAGGDALPPA